MAEEDTEFKDIWADAFTLYHQKTERDLKHDSALMSLNSTDDLLKQIEIQQHNFSAFRQRKAKLWTVLRGAMQGVEVVGSLTENALTLTPFSYASPILGAVLYLVSAAKGVSEAYDSITNLLSQLEDFTGRLEEYTTATVEPKLRRKIVDILTTLLEIFAKSEKLIKKARFKQYISVTFLGGSEKVAEGMERLRSLVKAESKLVGSLTYSTALRTRDTVDRSEKVLQRTDKATERSERKLENIAASMNDSRQDAKDKEERNLLNKALDDQTLAKVRDKHDDVTERRLSGTGDWIKVEPLYQEWIREESPILWILGGPGAGKSFLSSKIISSLQEVHPQEVQRLPRVAVAYFTSKKMTSSCDPSIPSSKSKEGTGTAKRTWDSLFMNYFGSRQSRDSAAFVLIDGLDEAPRKEREIFLQLLCSLEKTRSLGSPASLRLQFAMVGRPELRESISSIWDSQIIFIEVSALKNSLDINNYVLKSIDRVKALKLRHIPLADRKNLRKDIIEKLEGGANGMFLWVNLMLDQIYNTSRPSDIINALNLAPQDLDKMIRHVFERIAKDPSVNRADLNEILIWVTCAQERLRLGEMDTILKLKPPLGEGMLDLEDRLRGQFASFFTLSREDNISTERLQLRLRDERREKLIREGNANTQSTEGHVSPSDDLDDEGNLDGQVYESPFDTTYLEFSHASVRDFLLQEGNPETRRWPIDLGVGIEINKAQHHITVTLLKVLCDEEHDTNFAENKLSRYAADHCLFHLQRIDRSILTKSEKEAIVRPLFTVFHDKSRLEGWFNKPSSPFDLWIRGDINYGGVTECVRGWFTDEEINDYGFTSEELSKIGMAARSTADLFKPRALHCADTWVGPGADEYDPEFYVWFLHVYLNLDGSDSRHIGKTDINLERLVLNDFSIDRLRLLANFGDFPRSSTWYRRLAKILRDAGYINAALKEFDTSLRLNSKDSATMEGVSFCYEEKKSYLSAIEWATRAEAFMAPEDTVNRARCLLNICRWQLELNDRKSAIQAIHKALSLAPNDIDVITQHLKLLDLDSNHSEIMELVDEFQRSFPVSEDESMLSQVLDDSRPLEFIFRAAEALGKTEVITRALENSLAASKRTMLTTTTSQRSYDLARFKCRHTVDNNGGIQIWEDLLAEIASKTLIDSNFYLTRQTLNALSLLYYDEAIAAEIRSEDPSRWISKLENLAKPTDVIESTEMNTREENLLLLGLWYRLHGRSEEARARFKVRMLEAIDILTDEYPENDSWGFVLLAYVLRAAGNDDNATAAIAVSMVSLDKFKGDRPTSDNVRNQVIASTNGTTVVSPNPENSKGAHDTSRKTTITDDRPVADAKNTAKDSMKDADVEGDHCQAPLEDFETLDMGAQKKPADDIVDLAYGIACDGECNRPAVDWEGLYICDICNINAWFCEKCVGLVKQNQLGFRICNSNHSFWQVYPHDPKLLDVVTEQVDGKIVPRASWLESLRTEWAV